MYAKYFILVDSFYYAIGNERKAPKRQQKFQTTPQKINEKHKFDKWNK
jgi:hypothetical protein